MAPNAGFSESTRRGVEMIEDVRLTRARLRTEVRSIDAQIGVIEKESRLFRRNGFGSDVHEIQLSALRAERADRVRALADSERPQRRRSLGRSGVSSWIVLPAVFGAFLLSSLRPRRRKTVPRQYLPERSRLA